MNSKFSLKQPSRSSSSSSSKSRSRSRRSSSSSSSSKSFKSYSDSFSELGSNVDKKSLASLDTSREKKKKIKKKSLSSSPDSSSKESLTSAVSKISKANSLKNLEEEYKPLSNNLPYNVYQALFSIKDSMVNIYMLKKKHKENSEKLKNLSDSDSIELRTENEKLGDLMIKEALGCISLSQVIYGSSHWKLALAYTNLAQIYLEICNLPKQAKHHCENAWSVLVDDLKDQARFELGKLNDEQSQEANYKYIDPDLNKHQMILNYTYGRACTILKENEEGQGSLEKSEEFYENWEIELNDKKLKSTFKEELAIWGQKIYLALAKQYAINKNFSNALVYYDKCIDLVRKPSKTKIFLDEILIEIYQDKAKIELAKSNHGKAVDILKDALLEAEKNGSDLLVLECKYSLAKVFSDLDDMNSSDKAEELFKEVIESYGKLPIIFREKLIKAKDDLSKYYLKQDKYDYACQILTDLLKEKIDFYGDFSLKVNTTYKFLCSIHLKRNDMSQAVKYLQKSYDLEELNYGKADKRTQVTKETLDKLKKNPSVQTNGDTSQTSTEKPHFNVVGKIDYSKLDKSLYSTNLDESNVTISKKINPIK